MASLDSFKWPLQPTRESQSPALRQATNTTAATAEQAQPYQVATMSAAQQAQWRRLLGVWIVLTLAFWIWWLLPQHVVSVGRMVLNSALLFWLTATTGLYFYFVARMTQPNPALPLPDVRVAMIVTKTPAEPFALVRETLLGMLAQTPPHDVWLADEAPDEETVRWCQEHDVYISSRRYSPTYHQPTWPRRARSKEGNLAYFYDRIGYDRYDVVVQLDADHRPAPGYLAEMLRPFNDPQVGYVSAPSICDANAGQSWAARGRLHAEAGMHGAQQAGLSNGFAPLCIGSHYAVRTSALWEIGGLGPELAEDHSTTLLMNAHGWRGVHALEAEAHGDGPASFADCMTQEFQWSRSLMNLFLTLTPRQWGSLPSRLRRQFVYAQLWYPTMALVMLFAWLLPLSALISRRPWLNLSYLTFAIFSLLITLWTIFMMNWIRQHGWLRAKDVPLISWELALFQITRWPWVLFGVLAAFTDRLRGQPFDFRVTPKGQSEEMRLLSARLILPYVCLAAISALFCVWRRDAGAASGYYYFAILNTLVYSLAAGLIVALHLFENRVRHPRQLTAWLPQLVIGGAVLLLPLLALAAAGRWALAGVTWGYQQPIEQAVMSSGLCPGGFDLAADQSRLCQSVLPQVTYDPARLTVNLGVYDPDGAFADSDTLAIEHLYVDWRNSPAGQLLRDLTAVSAHERWPLVTVEPFAWSGQETTLLTDITAGRYDAQIDSVCGDLAAFGKPSFVRWGHEMENVTGRYPWATEDAGHFVAAYRYFVDRCRTTTADIYYVWSPLGNRGLEAYWPGRLYADYVGLSVYMFPAWEQTVFGRTRSFREHFGEKYARVVGYERPIMIAEMGVTGDRAGAVTWLNDALVAAAEFPELKTVVLFNAVDTPGVWPDVETPDWRISPELLQPGEQSR